MDNGVVLEMLITSSCSWTPQAAMNSVVQKLGVSHSPPLEWTSKWNEGGKQLWVCSEIGPPAFYLLQLLIPIVAAPLLPPPPVLPPQQMVRRLDGGLVNGAKRGRTTTWTLTYSLHAHLRFLLHGLNPICCYFISLRRRNLGLIQMSIIKFTPLYSVNNTLASSQ